MQVTLEGDDAVALQRIAENQGERHGEVSGPRPSSIASSGVSRSSRVTRPGRPGRTDAKAGKPSASSARSTSDCPSRTPSRLPPNQLHQYLNQPLQIRAGFARRPALSASSGTSGIAACHSNPPRRVESVSGKHILTIGTSRRRLMF